MGRRIPGCVVQLRTCMALVSLSERTPLITSSFWKWSKSVAQWPGRGSLCGSLLSNILLKPSMCFSNSSGSAARHGRVVRVSRSIHIRSDIQSGAGLGSCWGMVAAPAIKWRHSSYIMWQMGCMSYTRSTQRERASNSLRVAALSTQVCKHKPTNWHGNYKYWTNNCYIHN